MGGQGSGIGRSAKRGCEAALAVQQGRVATNAGTLAMEAATVDDDATETESASTDAATTMGMLCLASCLIFLRSALAMATVGEASGPSATAKLSASKARLKNI